jgi:phosphoribosylanthranilate isomerase
MQATTKPKVKICCISSREEARHAIAAGASALGLVARMPRLRAYLQMISLSK